MPIETTAVYLTDEEAKQFVVFQKHRALIGILTSIDAFSVVNGSITIHFDDKGRIGAIEKHQEFRA